MDPATIGVFIPIVALSIPIVAIIASTMSKRYKYLANTRQSEYVVRLEARVSALEATVQQMGGDLGRLEDGQRFVTRLLEDGRGPGAPT